MSFSEQVKRQRTLRGWSQAKLAEVLGTTPNTVGTWERGIALPSAYLREQLCFHFNMDAQALELLPENQGTDSQEYEQVFTTDFQQEAKAENSSSEVESEKNEELAWQTRLAATLSYVGLWLSGLLFVLFVPHRRFVRFHAMQSALFFGSLSILFLVIGFWLRHAYIQWPSQSLRHPLGAVFIEVILFSVMLIGWIMALIGAMQGKYYKLPIVGGYVERYINRKEDMR